MDGPLPRRCGTCRHHRTGPTPCAGRCQHPKLQPPDDCVRPLVRERELNCYKGWGRDFWEPKPGFARDQDGSGSGPRLGLDQANRFPYESNWQSTSGRAGVQPKPVGEDDWN